MANKKLRAHDFVMITGGGNAGLCGFIKLEIGSVVDSITKEPAAAVELCRLNFDKHFVETITLNLGHAWTRVPISQLKLISRRPSCLTPTKEKP